MTARTRRARTARRPTLEGLEDRKLQAGNVTANIFAGDLRITGDNLPNQVAVDRFFGLVRVRGLNGTLINGNVAPALFNPAAITSDVIGNMNNGDDTLSINLGNLLIPDDLIVNMGIGHDVLTVDQVRTADDMLITTGDGNDRVIVTRSTVGDDLRIDTGSGLDRVVLRSVQVADTLEVDLGSANNDQLELIVVRANKGRLRGGSGAGDRLSRVLVTIGDLQVDGFEVVS